MAASSGAGCAASPPSRPMSSCSPPPSATSTAPTATCRSARLDRQDAGGGRGGRRRVGRTAGRRTGRFSVVWHGGEPLAAGREHLAALLAPFGAGVEHHVQTNATLIDDDWCDVLHRARRPGQRERGRPGGPQRRPGHPGRQAGLRPDHARHRRAAPARHRRSPRSAWSADPRPGLATELYDYFLDLGCDVLGINVEELEGVNTRANRHPAADGHRVLGRAGRRPGAAIRASTCARSSGRCGTSAAVLDGTADELLPRRLDPIPTVAHDGSVVLLSPELAGFSRPPVRRLHQR